MSNIAVISTSINAEPAAYSEWAAIGDLYVAGDLTSPPQLPYYVEKLGGRWLSPDEQANFAVSSIIGWRNIQRRNTALLAALQTGGYDYIITVDDDNFPGPANTFLDLMHDRFDGKNTKFTGCAQTDERWFNPGNAARPRFRQRGLPATFSNISAEYTLAQAQEGVKVGVLQCVITGDPDCDAVQRIVNPVNVQFYAYDVYPDFGVYAPFNSQATIWPVKFAPLMAVLPGCERYDDIYASLIATKILHHLNHVVVYGDPSVHQERNVHDYGKDLLAEVQGMNQVDAFVQCLEQIDLPENMGISQMYEMIMDRLYGQGLIPRQAYNFMHALNYDLKEIDA